LEIEWKRLLNIIDVVVLGEGDDRVGWKIGRKGFLSKPCTIQCKTNPLQGILSMCGILNYKSIFKNSLASNVGKTFNYM
jgi:hypothetical protein